MLVKLVIAAVVLGVVGWFYRYHLLRQRLRFILNFKFPQSIKNKMLMRYPHLNDDDMLLVGNALRKYFYICNLAGNRAVSMPSQVVDVAWHEFILFTREYLRFCNKGLGRFLHHVPASAMPSPIYAREGIKRAWRLSCRLERIDHMSPPRLPLLFAIDALLKIPDGFYYVADCKNDAVGDGAPYCGSDISCSSDGCAGSGDASSHGGDGDGGGCGGD